jgi:hypothetical protein
MPEPHPKAARFSARARSDGSTLFQDQAEELGELGADR